MLIPDYVNKPCLLGSWRQEVNTFHIYVGKKDHFTIFNINLFEVGEL